MTRILYAEDQKNLREAYTSAMEVLGYEVTAAEDGLLAIEALNEGHFDVLLTDYQMPGANGLEVIEVAQSLEVQPKIIVLYTTAVIEEAIPNVFVFNKKTDPFSKVLEKIEEEL